MRKAKTIAARVEATLTNGFEHWVYIPYTRQNDTKDAQGARVPRCDVCHCILWVGPGNTVYCDSQDQRHHQHAVKQEFRLASA